MDKETSAQTGQASEKYIQAWQEAGKLVMGSVHKHHVQQAETQGCQHCTSLLEVHADVEAQIEAAKGLCA